MELIRGFAGLGKNDAGLAGGKGASLGEMTQAGIPVPPGFVVLASAFERFLEETDLVQEIDVILRTVNLAQMHTVEHASERIQALILGAQMPEDIRSSILQNYKTLDAEFVAVRSSATAEDSASAAWAGQLDSFLNTTEAELLKNVQRCWASLFTPRAIFYRFEKGLHLTKISVAVVVQKMVHSEVSGIAFSVHPVTEDRNQLIIEAGFGLGEAIVSGQVTPDSYVVEKSPRRIAETSVSTQTRGLYRAAQGGNEWKVIAEPKASSQVLETQEIQDLSDIILKIENHYGFPCDIEWAHEGGKFYIVQSRPITTLSNINSPSDSGVHEKLKALGLFDKEKWNEEGRWIQAPIVCAPLMHWASTKVVKRIVPDIQFGIPFNIEGYAFFAKKERDVALAYIKQGYQDNTLADLAKRLDTEGDATGQKVRVWLANDDEYIRAHLSEFFEIYEEWCGFWMLEAWLGDQMVQAAKEVGYIAAEADLFGKVQPHLRKTWIEDEAADMRKIAEEYLADKDEAALTRRLEQYVDRYRWIRFSKWMGEPIDEAYARQRLEEESKNVQEGNYIEPHRSSEEPDGMVALSACTAYWRAEGGHMEMEVALRFKPVLESIGKELGLTHGQMLLFAPQELVRVVQDPKSVDISDVLKRGGGFFNTLTEKGDELVLNCEDPDYQALKKLHLDQGRKEAGNELKGIGASPGKVTAKVRIILSMKDAHTFEDGEILVAPETTPSFVPLMRKASAILTGRGGITSHAAIVSRELKKPCVIAIKDITRILKTGDMVEVDADNGIVRILEQKRLTTLVKIHTREHSLFYFFVWNDGNRDRLHEFSGFNIHTLLFLKENPTNKVSVWYDPAELAEYNDALVAKLAADPGYFEVILKEYRARGDKILPYFKGEKKLERASELAEFYDNWVAWWSPFAVIFVLIDDARVSQDLRDKALAARAETQEYSDEGDRIFLEFFTAKYPEYARLSYVITPGEVQKLAQRGLTPADVAEIEKRISGYVLLNSKLQALSDLQNCLDKENLVLEKLDTNTAELKGASASPGKVSGKVRKVLFKKDIASVREEEILVTDMTSPDFVPAMKRAAAIVTDEGGITSHAAIASRELKKPCIIGTKFATQLLNDGDLIEVDANSGTVRILDRNTKAPDFLSGLNRQDFALTYESQGSDFLYENLSCDYYTQWEALACWKDTRVQIFNPKRTLDRLDKEGLARSAQDTRAVITSLDALLARANAQAADFNADAITLKEARAIFALIAEIFKTYSYFEASYWDGVYERSAKDGDAGQNVGLVQEYKNVVREKMNGLFFDTDSYLALITRAIGKKGGIPPRDAQWYRTEELFELFVGKKVPQEELDARRRVFVFYKDAALKTYVVTGQEADKFISAFAALPESQDADIKGKTASGRGVVKARACVITRDYSNTAAMNESMAQMIHGEVLVSETTDPAMMPAIQKASAIVTDIGGMLSHAAISARELGIPCIVETEDASKRIKTGDLIEVDANAGVVRILERA